MHSVLETRTAFNRGLQHSYSRGGHGSGGCSLDDFDTSGGRCDLGCRSSDASCHSCSCIRGSSGSSFTGYSLGDGAVVCRSWARSWHTFTLGSTHRANYLIGDFPSKAWPRNLLPVVAHIGCEKPLALRQTGMWFRSPTDGRAARRRKASVRQTRPCFAVPFHAAWLQTPDGLRDVHALIVATSAIMSIGRALLPSLQFTVRTVAVSVWTLR